MSSPAQWYIGVDGQGDVDAYRVNELWLQEARGSDGRSWVGGAIEFSDGSKFVIGGYMDQAPPDFPVGPPPPVASNVRIEGDTSVQGEELTVEYDLSIYAGAERGTQYMWMVGPAVRATGPTYETEPEDSGQIVRVMVTPRSSTGAIGEEQYAEIQMPVWEVVEPPIVDPGVPVWAVPSEFDNVLTKTHPRGPGPIEGPQPFAGPYLSVGEMAPHIGKADSWDPNGYRSAAWAWGAMDLAIAWLSTNDTKYLDKANAYLALYGTAQKPAHTWGLLASAIIADHFWDDLSPDVLSVAREAIRLELDAHRNLALGHHRSGWSDMYWEGWTQASGGHGYVWALMVFAGDTPAWRPLWDWWGKQWFEGYAPLYHTICTGPDGGSFPQQAYWASNVGGYIPLMHMALGIATGLDTFSVPENGGYLGPMLDMAWQRQTPWGGDIGLGNQTNNWYHPSYQKGLVAVKEGALIAHATRNPEGEYRALVDGHANPLVVDSRPWGFFPPATAPSKPSDPLTEWRCGHFGISRTDWTEDASFTAWMRGDYLLGHHRTYGPGHFVIGGGGGWLVGHPRHYGFGSGSEFWDRHITYNGMRFERPNDTASSESYHFTTSPGVVETLPYVDDGGPNLTGQNPHGYRLSQTGQQSSNPWEDFNSRRSAFQHSRAIGHGPGWEAIDWTPSFTELPPNSGLLFKPGINSRPTAVDSWVRVIATGPGWTVVLDDYVCRENVTPVWDLHLHGQPSLAGGAWRLGRYGALKSAEGAHRWPHVMPPATRANGADLTLDGDLWIRQLAGGGTWESTETPTSGVRQYPHPGQTVMADGKGPDDWAWWRLRLRPAVTTGAVCHALTAGPSELPAAFTEAPRAWTITIGGATVTIDRATYETVIS